MPPCPGALHQLQADGMAAVGQQGLGPEPVEHLLGPGRGTRRLRAGSGERSARLEVVGMIVTRTPPSLQVDHLRVPAAAERRIQPPGRAVELEDRQQLLDRGLALVVEDAAGQAAAIPAAARPAAPAPRGSTDAAPLDGSR